jgi:beta-lactamase regulating signal transducer with metallopeptidase domain
MIPSFTALELILDTAAIQAVALAILFFFRRISAAQQHRLLSVAVLAVILVTVASPFVPAWRLGLIPVEDVAARPDHTALPSPASEGVIGAVPGTVLPAEPSAPRSPQRIAGTLGTVWLAGSVLVFLWVLLGLAHGWWLSRAAQRSENARLTNRLRWALEQVGLRPDIPLAESGRLKIPVVFGLMRPRVILPAHAAGWPEDRLQAVLLHESAHIRRRDLVHQFFAKLTCALFWFNPLTWLIERKLFLVGERAADDQVIRRDVSPADYAEHLMETSEELGVERTPIWATAAMAEGTTFKDRILSILDPNVERGEPSRSDRTVVTLAAVAATFSLVAFSPWGDASSAMEEFPPPSVSAEVTPTPAAEPSVLQAGSQDEFETLLLMLRMQDADRREHAATALGRLGDPRVVLPLSDVVLNDPVAQVREHAASALGELGDPQAREALTLAMSADSDARVREHAVTALGQLRDSQAYEAILGVMHGTDVVEVRAHAAYALGLSGDSRALNPLLAALQDRSAVMRRNAAKGLGELGDPRAVDALRQAEDDPDEQVRHFVRRALGKIRGRP